MQVTIPATAGDHGPDRNAATPRGEFVQRRLRRAMTMIPARTRRADEAVRSVG
jgi:hypothetical protein